MSATATPRTDAAEFDRDEDCSIPDDMIVTADFARTLERELAALTERAAKLEGERDELKEHAERRKQSIASKIERMASWARQTLPEDRKAEFFNIYANGVADMHEVPALDIQMNLLRHERDDIRAQLEEARKDTARLDDLRRAAKAHADAVMLFSIARAEYDCDRSDENARAVSEASCRQSDCLETLEALLK